MVHFPVRKCYQAVKIAFLLILVVTVLALFEQWRGGKRNAGALYSDPVEAEYERQILEDEARIIPGLGEGGVAAHLMGEEKKLGEESEKKLAINVYLSDRIPYNRTLKDYRNPACQRVVYDAVLPSASVIIIFHNEPYSVVVRTIWSVVNSARRTNTWFKHANFVDKKTGRLTNMGYPNQEPNSPFVYLKEIILVDDNSTLPELKGKLSHYIRTRLPPDLIRILRLPDRIGLTQARMSGARVAKSEVMIFLDAHCEGVNDWVRPLLQRIKDKRTAVVTPLIDVIEQTDFNIGLTRARLSGARYATGDVLVFLDSHCEGQPDWLRPLLSAIKDRPHAVVVPIIDVIETSNFYYSVGDITTFQVGGFTFMGHFTWTDVPEREKKRRGSDIGPTWSPTMAGGLFAISREYFWELGAYDEQMAGWGGENLEMSFRIWQCGGTLETIPCSRVGHVFRSFHPYGLPASSDTHGINTARMAEVWMDEYAELFYMHRPDLRNNPVIGDVTHRRVLREKLKCKSFQWYLDNIYKEKFVPVRNVYGYGRFKNVATQLCLDTLQREGDKVPLGSYPCYPTLQATQYFSLSHLGEIRDEVDCATVLHTRTSPTHKGRSASRPVLMTSCHGRGRDQKWSRLNSGQLQHVQSGLCLSAPRAERDVHVTTCDVTDNTQIWHIDYSEDNNFRPNSDEEVISEERERRINKLRGHRPKRISRSLMSYRESETPHENITSDDTDVRRRMHKKKHNRSRSKKSKLRNKRTKNMFILKLYRSIMNDSSRDEHLEVNIYCKHKQLYPNNSFVRDIVNILNDNNIKIINNGRLFERNKVTDLRSDKVLNKMELGRPSPQPPTNTNRARNRDKGNKVYKKSKIISETPSAPTRQSSVIIKQEDGFNDKAAVGLGPPSYSDGDSRVTSGVKKIIIEDFVEVVTEHEVKEKRHKHKRKRRPPRPPQPHPTDHRHTHDNTLVAPLQMSNRDSTEGAPVGLDPDAMDSPLLIDDYNDNDNKKHKPHRVSKDRRNRSGSGEYQQRVAPEAATSIGDERDNTPTTAADIDTREMQDEDVPIDTDVHYDRDEVTAFEPRYVRSHQPQNISGERTDIESEYSAAVGDESEPVKLVMKSNFTFDLGDHFWNHQANDILSNMLDELSIPSNVSESMVHSDGVPVTSSHTHDSTSDSSGE